MSIRDTREADQIKRILILRPDNLGDLVLFSGAFRHLSERWPASQINLCCKRYTHNYLERCPYVHRLIAWEEVEEQLMEWPRLEFMKRVRGRNRLRRWVRRFSPYPKRYASDLLLVPLRSPTARCHHVARRIPARTKIGTTGDFSCQSPAEDEQAAVIYSRRFPASGLAWNEHELAFTQSFLRFLGIEVGPKDLHPEIWTHETDQRWARENIPLRENLVTLALAPGAMSSPAKLLPPVWYRQVLSEIPGVRWQIILFGSRQEIGECASVADAVATADTVEAVVNLTGRTTIRQLIEGLRRCDVVLSQDTAALHFACALAKPVIGITGGGHFGRFYPWGDPELSRVANKPMDCYGCNWQCKYDSIRCIQEIDSRQTADQLEDLLARLPRPSSPRHS